MFRWSLAACFVAVSAVGYLLAKEPVPKTEPVSSVPAYTFSGPFTHDNLTIYLIHGKDTITGKKILTLQEALNQKKVIVHETGNVNQLSMENISTDVEVFIEAGDIVKGGRQDRVVGTDLIVSAKSGKIPIASFCVESGRWHEVLRRGRERQDAGAGRRQAGPLITRDGAKNLLVETRDRQQQDRVIHRS